MTTETILDEVTDWFDNGNTTKMMAETLSSTRFSTNQRRNLYYIIAESLAIGTEEVQIVVELTSIFEEYLDMDEVVKMVRRLNALKLRYGEAYSLSQSGIVSRAAAWMIMLLDRVAVLTLHRQSRFFVRRFSHDKKVIRFNRYLEQIQDLYPMFSDAKRESVSNLFGRFLLGEERTIEIYSMLKNVLLDDELTRMCMLHMNSFFMQAYTYGHINCDYFELNSRDSNDDSLEADSDDDEQSDSEISVPKISEESSGNDDINFGLISDDEREFLRDFEERSQDIQMHDELMQQHQKRQRDH